MTDHATRPDPTADNPGGADLLEPKRKLKRAVTPRHAASLILWREGPSEPEILMGLRHAKHRFMPSVLVFPGGRVDRSDHRVRVLTELKPETRAALEHAAPPSLARALGVAAARELMEETGLVLGERQGDRLLADLGALDYLCRAVTPPTRSMRFNARFLIAPAAAVRGEIAGSGELEELGWYPLSKARKAKLAAITEMILDEFAAWHGTAASERAKLPRIVFRGNDNRMADIRKERSAGE